MQVPYNKIFLGVYQVAQWLKNLLSVQETWVRSLDQEDPLEKEMATQFSTFAWKFHGQRSLVGYSPQGRKESDTTKATDDAHTTIPSCLFP